MYTAETMTHFLGSEATDADAETFARYLIEHGWILEKRDDGEYEAHSKAGEVMTEEEWLEALKNCFS